VLYGCLKRSSRVAAVRAIGHACVLAAARCDHELGPVSSGNIRAIEADPDDTHWLRWDTQISGRPRPEDRNYWIAGRHGVPLWFTRGGRRVGYGMGQLLSDDLLWDPEALTLGPIGACERADAVGCVLAAVEWARRRIR
jgi:hypothetical protein